MASFKWNKQELEKFYNIVDECLEFGAIELQKEVKKLVPRDWSRPPKPIEVKGTKKDDEYYRTINGKKRALPQKNGNYYAPVSGNLSRSIQYAKVGDLEFAVGVQEDSPAEKYAGTQEFGNPSKKIPARSFLRKAIEDKGNVIINLIKEYLKAKMI